MNKVRIGIVGCGEVTQIMHLPSLAQLEEKFTIIALCDVSKQVLQAVGGPWQVSGLYLDYHELYPWLAVPALMLLAIEVGLTHTRFRKLP